VLNLGVVARALDGPQHQLHRGAGPVQGGFAQSLRITAAQGDTLRLITVDEICYFRADHKYTLVVTPDSEALIRRPLKSLAEEVDPQSFWQIHRSALVNVKEIAGVTRDFRGHLQVKLKGRRETLPVGENYVHLFKQM